MPILVLRRNNRKKNLREIWRRVIIFVVLCGFSYSPLYMSIVTEEECKRKKLKSMKMMFNYFQRIALMKAL